MTPVKQRYKHDPENGVWGDCHRAAVASVLDLALDDVPHFADGGAGGEEFERRVREYLLSRGLVVGVFGQLVEIDAERLRECLESCQCRRLHAALFNRLGRLRRNARPGRKRRLAQAGRLAEFAQASTEGPGHRCGYLNHGVTPPL